MAEFPFPCSLERTVASALLLLSTTPPHPSSSSPSKFISDYDCSFEEKIDRKTFGDILVIDDSKSCSSTITGDGLSENQVQKTSISAYSYRNELKLNVVRKSRSKLVRISENRNMSSGEDITLSSGSVSSEISSLSSNSTVVTSAPSRFLVSRVENRVAMIRRRHVWRKQHVATAHMRRRAEAILRYLSVGCSSEVKIRQVLGDSPDTSKALRMLLRLEEIKRFGTGGRQDPYIYMIA